MRFAFVTPRYGADISSGAEHACRLLAERLIARHDVEVLTTAARDARTWKNELGEGIDRVRGVLVRRFNVSQPHDGVAFQQLSDRIFAAPRSRDEEMEWVRRLGPTTPGLIDHLRRHHRSFDALVFFSLVHATTVHGLPIAPERSILFPVSSARSLAAICPLAGRDRIRARHRVDVGVRATAAAIVCRRHARPRGDRRNRHRARARASLSAAPAGSRRRCRRGGLD